MKISFLVLNRSGRLAINSRHGMNGKLALSMGKCVRRHIITYPDEPDIILSNGRQIIDTNTVEKGYCHIFSITGGPGEFDILARGNWNDFGSYKDYTFWVYLIPLGIFRLTKAPSDYLAVGHVTITQEARVFVNGADAGVWPEYLPSPPPAPEG